jgi:outer membrane lipoprotein-sorting protein
MEKRGIMSMATGNRSITIPGVSLILITAGALLPPSSGPLLFAQDSTVIEPSTQKEAAPDVNRLLEKLDELFESKGTVAQVEITIVKPKKTRTLRLRSWSKGEDKVLFVIESPARDAGVATLKVGVNLWYYLPKISRTIRVPPSMMMGSWMGSNLTNDDIVRESSYRDDYTSQLLGRSADPPGWKIQLIARPDAVGLWNRIEMVFSYETELPVQAQFFDRKDRLSRTMQFEEVKMMGGRLIPTVITVVPEREEGESTELRYNKVEFDAEVDESMFSLSHLERKR